MLQLATHRTLMDYQCLRFIKIRQITFRGDISYAPAGRRGAACENPSIHCRQYHCW